MIIVYDSKTGNVKRFVSKLPFLCFSVNDIDKVEEEYILITFTTGIGQCPDSTINFMERNENHKLCKGVISSGNVVWGRRFGAAADIVSAEYNIPVLYKFELSGDNHDVETVKQEVNKLVKMGRIKQ